MYIMPRSRTRTGMERDCPRCWVPLKKEPIQVWLRKVNVDLCPKCNGIYLDDGELRTLTGNFSLAKWLTDYLGVDSDSKLVCPGCGGVMDAERPGDIEVEVCLNCKGIWLDEGELEQLRLLTGADFRKGALSNEKLAELFDADRAAPASNSPLGLLGLFGRQRRR